MRIRRVRGARPKELIRQVMQDLPDIFSEAVGSPVLRRYSARILGSSDPTSAKSGHSRQLSRGVHAMSIGVILLIILVLFMVGALPTWPHSVNWGYFPSGGLGIVLLVVVILLVTGRI